VYTDLDGTLLGKGASLFHDADGKFSLLPARALEACFRAGVEVVLKSGRRKAQVMEDARLIGQTAYIYEMGCGLVIDGEETLLTGDLQPRDGKTVHDLIEESGAPKLLLDTYAGRLEHHSPWHLNRDISHLFRGLVNSNEADALLEQHGFGNLRLVDNGAIAPKESLQNLEATPRARGYSPDECIGLGDSREDLGVAAVVGRFFLVANAVEKDPDIMRAAPANVEVTEARNGEGFYEAVIRTLAER
jgi:hydroxymethylpyrimidine pyrophosphatase-like HAD family hydrolase